LVLRVLVLRVLVLMVRADPEVFLQLLCPDSGEAAEVAAWLSKQAASQVVRALPAAA
jgi:hypothetical protein